MERGCLWNSFVMIGHVNAFMNLIRHALPELVESFESIRQALFTYERNRHSKRPLLRYSLR